MEAMDKAGVSVEFHFPAFELHLLPRTRPDDLLSVTFMENVKRLEARVAALDTHAALSTEQMSILKQKVDHLETTAHASGSSCVSPETIPMSSMHFQSLNAINPAGTMSSSMDPTSSASVYSTRDEPFLEHNHAHISPVITSVTTCEKRISTSIPHSSVSRSGSRRSIPFWSTHVRPLKDNALFWHAICKSCDSPSTGVVVNIRRSPRAKYHRAIRYFRQNDQLARFARMGEHFVNQGRGDFWTEVKKMRGNNSATPTMVDDCLSEDDIALCFRGKYNILHNSVGYVPEEMARLRQEIEANACRHEGEMCRSHVLSIRDVTIAVSNLKRGKHDGHLGYM
ncbi:hypothetical protein CAPTEDRAFT_206130 [Capitella teleta]|uniref:Uncharacterized protein n=1 Tax=Capitella teleta TaxID=283909 RepID=R7UI25_CAPTE|nr:hypothetical protein CAPTEDRAFT_206130 [Capitella teleta]|eukprot:ELU05870.1 hypothetical protein CAPTEDRAFT_206130 [Capitella teleta]